jgi:hypothetical protein
LYFAHIIHFYQINILNMKQVFTLLLLLFAGAFVQAQSDTLLYEGFEGFTENDYTLFPFGDDTTWVSFDQDGLTPSTSATDATWNPDSDLFAEIDSITGDTIENTVMWSLSWMDGFLPGNLNWLITPPIEVTSASAVLHWRSAPFQLPRYMDGYSVLVSPTGSNDALSGVFTDTLFRAASMNEITAGDGQTLDPSNFSFTPGYLHGDYLNVWSDTSKWAYIAYDDETGARGLLEPHSVSLAPYVGKKIYIAFLHDADDDYFIRLDDVLVRNGTVSANEPSLTLQNVQTYPNPVAHIINLNFTLTEPAQQVQVSILSADGKQILADQLGARGAGQYFERYPVAMLPAGAYQLQVRTESGVVSRAFVKK